MINKHGTIIDAMPIRINRNDFIFGHIQTTCLFRHIDEVIWIITELYKEFEDSSFYGIGNIEEYNRKEILIWERIERA
jgi:hypothetical protein